jgi:hypothetical protein
MAQWARDRHFAGNQVPDLAKQDQIGIEKNSFVQTKLQDTVGRKRLLQTLTIRQYGNQ